MPTITLENPGVGTEIAAGLHATNYSDIQTLLNGGLDNSNISASAVLDAVARVGVRKNSTGSTFNRRRINLIEGAGVTLTVADDSANEEVDVTIAASTAFSGVAVYRTSNVTVTQGAGLVAIAWDNEEFDTDTYHDNATNNTRLTVPTTGKYALKVMTGWTGSANGVAYQLQAFKNGTTEVALVSGGDLTSLETAMQINTVLNLTASDYIEIRASKAAAANNSTIIGTQGKCRATLHRLG